MNGDTIALSTDYLYVDTGSDPVQVRNRTEKMVTNGDLWITIEFHPKDNRVSLRTYPEHKSLQAVKDHIRIVKEGFRPRFDFVFEKVGDDRVIIKKKGKANLYYQLYDNRLLEATTNKTDEATRFRVVRLKERLRTKIRGVNLANWFMPNNDSNPDFFNGSSTYEAIAMKIGEKKFRQHY